MVHADHLARPIRITDAAHATVWQASYTPWGEPQSISGTLALDLRFPGQLFQIGEAEEQTIQWIVCPPNGLAYNWHRHYDPTTGRYTQPDPLRFVDGPSIYAYAGNSPAIRVDRDGRSVKCGQPGICVEVPDEDDTGGMCKPGIDDIEPDNFCEQLALAEAKAGAGEIIMESWQLADEPRLIALYGKGSWVKKQHKHTCPNGRELVIHYFSNGLLNVELKFTKR